MTNERFSGLVAQLVERRFEKPQARVRSLPDPLVHNTAWRLARSLTR
jgi:hypothetical protein